MNEFEKNTYLEIKNKLVQSVIDKKFDTYFTNRNELTHYYNVGKMIVNAQGGEERAKYGNGLIKKISEKLTKELGRGYSEQSLKKMRRFFLCFQKRPPVAVQSLSWSHYELLLTLKDDNEINYYIEQVALHHWGKRTLQEKIKNKEYQKLSDETKLKLINKKEIKVYDLIKNPITINTYDISIDKENIEEKVLKSLILKDMPNFLKQLGNGFSFIDEEYKILIGNTINYIDILLFNYIYDCFVVVELKVTNSKKDHLGQIQVYMNYVDKHIRTINQSKTIGIIVCKKDDKYLIEYSSDDRIRITTYELV